MLDYKLLEALAVVVQERGFDKAAHRLGLTQSAVSQRIKQLEEQIGHVVIARTSPPQATKIGQKFIKHFLQIDRLEGDLFDSIVHQDQKEFITLSIGTNRDCLATWLKPALQSFLMKSKVVVDFRAADQEQTHQLMKDGEVMGCISVKQQPMQGCKVDYLGRMKYWLVAAPGFAARYFPKGVGSSSVREAPLVCFDRKDEMHHRFFQDVIKEPPDQFPIHYVPSTRTYADFIHSGLAYGLLPEQECRKSIDGNELMSLFPQKPVFVNLYWHFWNLKSVLLDRFSTQLVRQAKMMLYQ